MKEYNISPLSPSRFDCLYHLPLLYLGTTKNILEYQLATTYVHDLSIINIFYHLTHVLFTE